MCVACHAAAACREAEHEGEGDSVTKLHEDLSGQFCPSRQSPMGWPHAQRSMHVHEHSRPSFTPFLQPVVANTSASHMLMHVRCHPAPSAAMPWAFLALQMRSTSCFTRSTAVASRLARRAAVTRSRSGPPMAARVRGVASCPAGPCVLLLLIACCRHCWKLCAWLGRVPVASRGCLRCSALR
jgi:hypothetical protein